MIVDASVFLAILLNEPAKDRMIARTRETDIRSPEVLPYEVANALSSLMRREEIDDTEALRVFSRFTSIPVNLVSVNIAEALKISARFSIFAYDAYYLEVAMRRSLSLLTLDKKMRRIAGEMGIVCVEVEE